MAKTFPRRNKAAMIIIMQLKVWTSNAIYFIGKSSALRDRIPRRSNCRARSSTRHSSTPHLLDAPLIFKRVSQGSASGHHVIYLRIAVSNGTRARARTALPRRFLSLALLFAVHARIFMRRTFRTRAREGERELSLLKRVSSLFSPVIVE